MNTSAHVPEGLPKMRFISKPHPIHFQMPVSGCEVSTHRHSLLPVTSIIFPCSRFHNPSPREQCPTGQEFHQGFPSSSIPHRPGLKRLAITTIFQIAHFASLRYVRHSSHVLNWRIAGNLLVTL